MEFLLCESVGAFFGNEDLTENYMVALPPTCFKNFNLSRYLSEKPVRRGVRQDGLQKWVLGTGYLNEIKGLISVSIEANGSNTFFHEATVHTCIGSWNYELMISRTAQQSRIDSLNILVNEMEVKFKSLSEESVRTHDRLLEMAQRSSRLEERNLESTRLITILRERVASKDNEILNLKEDKISMQKRFVEIDTSLNIANEALSQVQATTSQSHLINIGWPLSSTELRVTATVRATICKQDNHIGSYDLNIVEFDTYNICNSQWFSIEVNVNHVKKLLVRWMTDLHPNATQNGSAVDRQMPSYTFTPKDILLLMAKATGSNFILTSYKVIKECDWLL